MRDYDKTPTSHRIAAQATTQKTMAKSQPLERFVMKATGRDSPCSAVNKLRRIVASTSCEQVRARAIASAMAESMVMVVTRDSHPIHIAI